MLEALCRQSSTTLDIVHAEDGPPITQRTSGLDPLGDNEVHKTVKSRGNQPRLNKLVEILVKATPRRAESASCRNVFWQLRV